MADLLSNSLSISPVTLSGLVGIPPVALQRLTAGVTAPNSSVFSNTSNFVELSSSGQLLSAVATFRTNLQALQALATNNSPPGTQATLVGTIQSLIDLASEFESQAIRSTIPPSNLAELGVAAAPQIDLGSIIFGATNSATPADEVTIDLLQNLSADTVFNAIRLTDLDLAAVGLDIETLQSESSVIRGALATSLLTPDNPPNIATITGESPANVSIGTSNSLADARRVPTPTPSEPSTAAPVTTTPPLPIAPPITIPITTTAADNQLAASAVLVADTMAAEHRAAAATQALQTLLADPGLRAIKNLFDPAYSALIAASHLSDFVLPSPVLDPKALADDAIAPVSPINMAHAIAYYNETAGAKPTLLLQG